MQYVSLINNVCPFYLGLQDQERELRHQEIMAAYNTLRANTLTCEILTPLPILGKFGPTPNAFELDLNFPVLVTNDNIDGLVDGLMNSEHPRVPYIIHRELLNKLQQKGLKDREMCDPKLYTPITFNLSKNKKFLQEVTRQDEAYDQLSYASRKWANSYPAKRFNSLDLHIVQWPTT